MIKYRLHATIGLPDYSNLQPEIELEGENIDELHSTAMAHIQGIWDKYGKTPLKGATGQIEGNGAKLDSKLEELSTFTGETILWDEANHKYFDKDGNLLLSGSAYADSVSPKFDKAMLLPKTAKSWGVDAVELDDMWNLGGRVSTEYGSAIHTAMESWHKYRDIGAKIQEQKGLEYNYVLPKNTHIRDIVLAFDKALGGTIALPELLISDVKNKMAGRIDLLEIIDKEKKVCRVGDYKTNNDLDDKKIKKYQHQLSFYASILANHGWSVSGLDIFHYTGEEWNKIELEVLPISK